VHPESYPVAEAIAASAGRSLSAVIGDSAFLKALDPAAFVTAERGLPTVRDIIAELDKPGRDPRPAFQTAKLRDDVQTLADLAPDMVLEGTVTNVTNFGAFVDIGVHQDGLVHISRLADRFIKDPHSVVKAGDIVTVKVLAVDAPRKRISLTMRLSDSAAEAEEGKTAAADSPRGGRGRRGDRRDSGQGKPGKGGKGGDNRRQQPAAGGAMAAAFAKARRGDQ
jgi:uncharacterized protein